MDTTHHKHTQYKDCRFYGGPPRCALGLLSPISQQNMADYCNRGSSSRSSPGLRLEGAACETAARTMNWHPQNMHSRTNLQQGLQGPKSCNSRQHPRVCCAQAKLQPHHTCHTPRHQSMHGPKCPTHKHTQYKDCRFYGGPPRYALGLLSPISQKNMADYCNLVGSSSRSSLDKPRTKNLRRLCISSVRNATVLSPCGPSTSRTGGGTGVGEGERRASLGLRPG